MIKTVRQFLAFVIAMGCGIEFQGDYDDEDIYIFAIFPDKESLEAAWKLIDWTLKPERGEKRNSIMIKVYIGSLDLY
jgi:hypothetical protein